MLITTKRRGVGIRFTTVGTLSLALMACGGSGTGGADPLQPSETSNTSASYSAPSNNADSKTGTDTTTTGSGTTTSDSSTVKTSLPSDSGTVSLPSEVSRWEQDMITYGKKWGDYISNSSQSFDNRLNAVYYDGEWVFYQIADYTGQSEPWLSYARAAEKVYRDGYARANNYKIPGYWRFPHGLYEDFVRGGDTTANDIAQMRDNPAYSNPDTSNYAPNWYHVAYSREVAYAIHANIVAEKAGFTRKETRMQMYLGMAKNHLDQWQSRDYSNPPNSEDLQNSFKPFMFGLTAHALIDFYEWEKKNGRDPDAYFPDIPGRLASFARWMYADAKVVDGTEAGKPMWVNDLGGSSGAWNDKGGTGYGAFRYRDRLNDSKPSPDLNLLIAPIYAWLYKETGDMSFRQYADRIFSSGVALAAIQWNGKIFDQNYRWSFKYIQWRKEGDKRWR